MLMTTPDTDSDLSQAGLDLALDAAGILGTAISDRQGLFLPDARLARSFGLQGDGAQPAAELFRFILPQDIDTLTAAWARAGLDPAPVATQVGARRPDGRVARVEVTARLRRPSDPDRRLDVVFRDVTSQWAVVEALRAAEARTAEAAEDLQATLDAAPVAIWIARDPDAARIDGNRAGRDMLRIPAPNLNLSKSSEDAAINVQHFRVLDADGQELAPAQMPIQRAARGEIVRQFEERVVFDDGDEIWLTGSSVPLFAPDGTVRGAVGAFVDVTARKTAEAALAASERFMRTVVESQPECLKVCDPEGLLMSMNAAGLAILGLDSVAPLLGRDPSLLVDERDRPNYLRAQAEAANGKTTDWIEFGITTPGGLRRWMEGRATPLANSDGTTSSVLWTTRDLTDRQAATAALRESELRFRNVADHSPAMMWITNVAGRCIYLNRTWCEITGQAAGDAIRAGKLDRIHPSDRAAARRAFRNANTGKRPFRIEYRIRSWDGQWRWVLDAGAPRWSQDGEFMGFVGSMIDITDRKVAEADLESARQAAEYSARHDNLTGLLCRGSVYELLEDRLAATGPDEPGIGLLLIDIDDFKSTNDAFGHPAGDELLRIAGERLRQASRENDLLGRVGGDEFVAVLQGVTDLDHLRLLGQQVSDALREPYLIDGQMLFVGASVGAALATDPDWGADDLVKRADIALYSAKDAGRAQVCLYEPVLEARAVERQHLRIELRDAIRRGQMRLVYQPIVDLRTGQPVRFEALLRWHHPVRGPLGPSEFIPLAEATGDIEAIGAWVLGEACREASAWPDGIGVSVNLSPQQFRGSALIDRVSSVLQKTGLPPRRLQVEITESTLLQDDETVLATLSRLTALGVRLSIDDFGSGYSSLGYLRRFSADNIKIDRSFIADLMDQRSTSILRAMVSLGRELNLSLTVEGIETPVHLEHVRSMGCSEGQGYLISHPVPPEEVPQLLAAARARSLIPGLVTAA
jgi:diguanylate cyclase (GGDEF)-like protein/PAS domain S-box-containing protein